MQKNNLFLKEQNSIFIGMDITIYSLYHIYWTEIYSSYYYSYTKEIGFQEIWVLPVTVT